jgi:hypothetical protein
MQSGLPDFSRYAPMYIKTKMGQIYHSGHETYQMTIKNTKMAATHTEMAVKYQMNMK